MRLRRRLSDPVDDPTARETAQVRERLADPVTGPELRALLSVGARREARDRHAMSVLLAASLARDAHTIDIGAHSGAVLREIVRVAPEGRHIAFEPLPELAALLRAEFPQVDVRQAALADETGESRFVQVDSAPEFSGLRERSYPGQEDVRRHDITVRTERLDDALDPGFAPALIKIDVEGAEMLVLRGALETLRRHRPAIVFEHGVGASDRYGTTPGEIHELLTGELGLRIFDLDGAGPYDRGAFEMVFAEPIWNFLARP